MYTEPSSSNDTGPDLNTASHDTSDADPATFSASQYNPLLHDTSSMMNVNYTPVTYASHQPPIPSFYYNQQSQHGAPIWNHAQQQSAPGFYWGQGQPPHASAPYDGQGHQPYASAPYDGQDQQPYVFSAHGDQHQSSYHSSTNADNQAPHVAQGLNSSTSHLQFQGPVASGVLPCPPADHLSPPAVHPPSRAQSPLVESIRAALGHSPYQARARLPSVIDCPAPLSTPDPSLVFRKQDVALLDTLVQRRIKKKTGNPESDRMQAWREQGYDLYPNDQRLPQAPNCPEDLCILGRLWRRPEEREPLWADMVIYHSQAVCNTTFVMLTTAFLRRHPKRGQHFDWYADFINTARPDQRAVFSLWFLVRVFSFPFHVTHDDEPSQRISRWYKNHSHHPNLSAFLDHNFESVLRAAMELVRGHRHLSVYQAYYQLYKDEVIRVCHGSWLTHVEEVDQDILKLELAASEDEDPEQALQLQDQAAKMRPMPWVNWSQSFIKNMWDNNYKPRGCIDWADRRLKTIFLAENGHQMGTEKAVREPLTSEEIKK
jgi:hypothetical protein